MADGGGSAKSPGNCTNWLDIHAPRNDADTSRERGRIHPAVLVNRFTLTESGVVIIGRRRVVQLNVAGPFARILRGSLLCARLLWLVCFSMATRCPLECPRCDPY